MRAGDRLRLAALIAADALAPARCDPCTVDSISLTPGRCTRADAPHRASRPISGPTSARPDREAMEPNECSRLVRGTSRHSRGERAGAHPGRVVRMPCQQVWLARVRDGTKSELLGGTDLVRRHAGGFALLKDVVKGGSPGWCAGATSQARPPEGRAGLPIPAAVGSRRPPFAESATSSAGIFPRDSYSTYDVLARDPGGLRSRDLDGSIWARGLPAGEWSDLIGMVDRAESKRRQVAAGDQDLPKAVRARPAGCDNESLCGARRGTPARRGGLR